MRSRPRGALLGFQRGVVRIERVSARLAGTRALARLVQVDDRVRVGPNAAATFTSLHRKLPT